MKQLTTLGVKWNTDKATRHQFTEIYDDYFKEFTHPTILEIGVLGGASLEMYNDFYNGECFIIGMDDYGRIEYKSNKENIQIVRGNQSNIKDLLPLMEQEYDIIIDDGSHTCADQQLTFNLLFDSVKSNGIYIIEDLHTSFNKELYNRENIVSTIDILEQLKTGKYDISSPYISRKGFDNLYNQIKNIDVFWKTPKHSKRNSITSIIRKK